MKILFIAPRVPIPADTGGKIRTLHLINQIAKNHLLDLVCFSFDEEDQRYVKALRDRGINVTLVKALEPNLIKKIGLVLLSSRPYSVEKYYSRKMVETVREIVGKNSYDIIHIDHIHMTHYTDCFNGQPLLLDEHNVEYKILERCANVEKSWVKKALFKHQAKKMRKFEARKVTDFSACTTVSAEDSRILADVIGRKKQIDVLPNGVDTEYFKLQDTRHKTQEEEAVVFTGSMDWFPNDDAAMYFCNDILPHIWKENPRVKFYIVGKDPSAVLKDYAKTDNRIIVTGRVDDVRTYVEKSKIFVVPLRIGGGTRLKILEAMSMQKAVIATTIGAEGIQHKEGRNIILEDEPKVFAKKVVALLDDPLRREKLGNCGRALVLEKYDWGIIGEILGNIYDRIKK